MARAPRPRDDAPGHARLSASGRPAATTLPAAPAPVVGRFAPSTTGLLHAGSLVAALASWLDARAAGGRWLVRLEDLDTERHVPGADAALLAQLGRAGLEPDEPPVRQSERIELYEAALAALLRAGLAFPCGCSRRDVRLAAAPGAADAMHAMQAMHAMHAMDAMDAEGAAGEVVYPGTCRDGLHGKPVRSWRVLTAGERALAWHDRRLGARVDDVESTVGDFVVRRAGGPFAYQLAVVVDDAAQGVTDVVRGEDLVGNTARQILLQRRLGLATPRYLHVPLVRAADGRKLSKQTGAPPIDDRTPASAAAALRDAARRLGLDPAATDAGTVPVLLDALVAAWRVRWPLATASGPPEGTLA